jgi:hypothetical protein
MHPLVFLLLGTALYSFDVSWSTIFAGLGGVFAFMLVSASWPARARGAPFIVRT